LGGRRHATLLDQGGEELHDVPLVQLARMPEPMEPHEAPHPAGIGLLGPQAIVAQTQLEPQSGQ
jgi:hypothetical protein